MLYTDGGSRGNPGPSAIGVLIYSQQGMLLASHKEYIGQATNNQAEYAAVLEGLEMAREFTEGGEVLCHSDSKLMVNQLSGDYAIKEPRLKEACQKVKESERSFSMVRYIHLPRTDPRIKLADALVNRVLDKQ